MASQASDSKFGASSLECPSQEWETIPNSVHALRPADIKVIAAMGDSLTTANGAGAQRLLDVLLEYRGLAFDIGGDGDLQYMVTLPNVLREFNPNLVGASSGVSPVWYRRLSALNVAFPGAFSADMANQAQDLVRRIQNRNDVDFEQDWKLVTVFVGANDLCYSCQYQSQWDVSELTVDFQRELVDLVQSGDYDKREDFTVVLQRFIENTTLPNVQKSDPGSGMTVDLSLFAPDCFHWSQLGHSYVSRALWNGMFEPVGNKSTEFNVARPASLRCPDSACPFIRTSRNSENCSAYLPHEVNTSTTVVVSTSGILNETSMGPETLSPSFSSPEYTTASEPFSTSHQDFKDKAKAHPDDIKGQKMRAVIQRVLMAQVNVGEELVSSIGRGICVLIDSKIPTDGHVTSCGQLYDFSVRKLLNLRVFENEEGKRWSKNVSDYKYEILCVSQFTLHATLKGNKPDFHLSMAPELAPGFYEKFMEKLRMNYDPNLVKDGKFGEYMQVLIKNDGPVTISIDSRKNPKEGNSEASGSINNA